MYNVIYIYVLNIVIFFFSNTGNGQELRMHTPFSGEIVMYMDKSWKFSCHFGYILARSLNSSLFSNNFKLFQIQLLVFIRHLLI